MRSIVVLAPLTALTISLAGCGSDDSAEGSPSTTEATAEATTATQSTATDEPTGTQPAAESTGEQMFPDVIGAEAERSGDTWTIAATLSSPYDSPERYADAWRVVGPDGEIYGERVLTHDHASEQPFTRSESGIEIPDEVTEVVIEGRDLEFGYGGETFTLALPN